ncbi:hypothetical protein [Aequorivita sublithincola]|uniref:hypothetical protein n=1 Tax=Aequorivita sublithincola TaxID=101385 RepID=UPI0002D6AE09|nr:hypothetical protein [Aequorivita sublithincola]
MRKKILLLTFLIGVSALAQETKDIRNDSVTGIKKTIADFSERNGHPFTTGYLPVGFFDIDLKTLFKYNAHEGFRLGIGGVTNEKLFENYKLGGYIAYGFKDEVF